MNKEVFVPRQYVVTKENSQVSELHAIKGVNVIDMTEERDMSLIELTDEGSFASLLKIRRKGYEIHHAIIF